ncbi:MAG: tetratricopeptide repeat protein, partial [bacterium]|nr:tetratricopeptide repeat protein [bacterium]
LTLVDEKGKPILHDVPVQRPGNPKPQTVTPPGEPKEFKSNEELYLAGLRLNEFYNTKLDPNTYYNEALSRDPNDSRVNTQLGILAIQGGRFDEAEGYLRRAVERITYNYTRPRDCDAHYFLGLALRYLGRTDEAYDQFFRASWDLAWRSAAYYQLAELDCGAGAYESALENITHSIETNTLNPKAWNLKATIQRHLGLTEAARITLSHLNTLVPIDYWTLNEMVLHQVQGSEKTLKKGLSRDIELVLELATDYGNAGFLHDAIAILQQHGGTTHPMPQYYLSYYNHILGKVPETQAALIQAAKASPDYVFPYRLETIAVLHHAMRLNPSDALAPYYLGNLLFDSQPETAKALWQDAMAKNPAFAMAHRNLGYAIAREGENLPQAIALYEKAIVADPQNARLFYELDRLYESANRDPQERLALLTRNEAVIATRDDAMARLVSLQIRLGDYSDAIHTLTHRHFFTWEGGGEIHNDFIDAHLCRGIAFLHQNQPRKAALDFLMANEYPENLEVGRPLTDPNAIRTFYYVGLAKQTMGETEAAMDCFQRALAIEGWSADTLFYKGLALRALGNEAEAAKAFERLLQDSQKRLTSSGESDFFAKFGEQQSHNNRLADAHYLSGLAYLGQNQFGQAQQQFDEALKLNSNHLWASVFSAYSATIVPKGDEK